MLKAGTAARRRTQSWHTPQAAAEVRQNVEALLRTIDTRLQASADWVGHVKILITNGAETSYGSITAAGDTPRWSGTLTQSMQAAELTIYAAIYTLTDAQVAAAIDQALAADQFTAA